MILDLLYPLRCVNCKTSLNEKTHFCQTCFEHFTLLPKEGRCAKCFSEIAMLKGICKPCRKVAQPLYQFAGCFDAHGPALALANAFIKDKSLFLAKELAAYFVLQLDQLEFPPFDVIVPMPKRFDRSQLLVAKQLAKMLNVPCKNILRNTLSEKVDFHLKNKCNIINQSVLLLDLVTYSPEPIRAAAKALKTGWCETLYGMTLCVV